MNSRYPPERMKHFCPLPTCNLPTPHDHLRCQSCGATRSPVFGSSALLVKIKRECDECQRDAEACLWFADALREILANKERR